ncbi:hypothetical protein [Streptomyces sp. NPDC050264]|uniref:hypothetical protein n=1 Tax=Streptomyces sp. NPDC050264 TaxID=3155038 RepID=UPI00344358CF
MPSIRVLQSVGGLEFSWRPGQVVEVDDATAAAWADGVRAELVGAGKAGTGAAPASRPQGADEGAPFDPTAAKVDEVLAYLATADEAEALRVLDAESAAKKPRASIVKERDAILAAARERDGQEAAALEEQAPELAADSSRGGGRAESPETRSE